MQNKTPQPPSTASSLTLADIYYVLFKHKWMILCFFVAGMVGAAVAITKVNSPYRSDAKLLVRYVSDTRSGVVEADDAAVRQVDARGEGIMSAEAEILNSLDVAAKVVEIIGPEKILGPEAGTTNRELAARVLKNALIVEVPRKGQVMRVAFQHNDPQLVQPVLRHVIDNYFKRHVEIHRALGVFDEFLTQKTDQIRSRLAETEEELRKLKAKANIVSLDDSKRVLAEQHLKLREALSTAEVELNTSMAALAAMRKEASGSVASLPLVDTNAIITNVVTAVRAKPSKDEADEYKRMLSRIATAYRKHQDLLLQFTEENQLVKQAKASIEELIKKKKEMEVANPLLVEVEEEEEKKNPTSVAATREAGRIEKAADFTAELAKVAGLQAKTNILHAQIEKVRLERVSVDEVEAQIVTLQRKKEMEDKEFRDYTASLDQAHLDTALGAGKLANISEIQAPSLPVKDTSKLMKFLGGSLAFGILGGVVIAFLKELVFSQKIRRPGELEKLRIPVFLSIPSIRGNKRKLIVANGNGLPQLKSGKSVSAGTVVETTKGAIEAVNNLAKVEVAPWEENHELHPYSEALRDRLVTHFEVRNMTHKPKLIALTSCSKGAGVTTLAAGLAASLSETGEGNVLLVDMNVERGAAHPFYRGKPACGLADALETDNREAAMVQNNLYVVNGGTIDDRLPRILPKRFTHLLPKLQASDYDYIIFDMPPIDQTSVTPRLAGFMDMVFLVVEAEETNREWAKHASMMLAESKANVGAVFNKRRNYVPRWLHQEF